MKFFKGLQTDDLGRVQDLVEKAFDKVDDVAVKAENLVVVSLRTIDTPVFHGLGRPIRGWIVVRLNAAANVWEGATPTNPAQFVNLRSSLGGAAATILFF